MKVIQSTVSNAPKGGARRVVNAKTNVAIRENKYSSTVSGAKTLATSIRPISMRYVISVSNKPQKAARVKRSAVIAMQEIRQRKSSIRDGNSEFQAMKCVATNAIPIMEALSIARDSFSPLALPDQNRGPEFHRLSGRNRLVHPRCRLYSFGIFPSRHCPTSTLLPSASLGRPSESYKPEQDIPHPSVCPTRNSI
jgi:hypothetical protein